MELRQRALTIETVAKRIIDYGGSFAAVLISVSVAAMATAAAQTPATANGTLTVGASKFALAHVYAVPDRAASDPAKASYRIFVTDRVLTAAEMKLARTAGGNDDDRQALAVEFADRKISGVEAIVGPDKRLTRVNVYSPDSAMGLMLLEPGQFDVTTLDGQRVAGKLFTPAPIQDPRIRKSIQYAVTISAPVDRAAAK